MYDFIILLSRYLFIIYIAVFVLMGLIFVTSERSENYGRLPRAISVQRKVMILMHLTA